MKTGKKITGGRYHKARKKKLYEMKGQTRVVKLGEEKKKTLRTRGGNFKTILLSANLAYITNKRTLKVKKAKITNVIETPSNKFLAKQNIITKGAIIDTDLGKAKVTNRPSQSAVVQAVLVE